MSFISAYLLYGLFLLLGLLPFRIFYAFSSLLAWFLNHIIGYRKKVTLANLETIHFADVKTKNHALREIYKNLADIFLEGIRAFTISKKQIIRRHRILNPELLDPYFESGSSMICVTGHYCNWEWGVFSAALYTPFHIVGFYKPIQNKWLDRIVRNSRSRYGAELASIKETAKTFEKTWDRPVIYLMAADQSPRKIDNAIRVKFLGRDTAFLHGPEKYSRQYDHPVFYADIRRVKRGYYTLYLSIIADNPASLPDGEVTRRFAEKLESVIKEEPANWLWSHKRWKLNR
jgi:Kdo2-lipid IVA lauroyltransferase/acyltransferase